jgi:hypothetical protein
VASPTKEQQDAAQQFVGLAIEAFKNERGVHAETAIAGVARMAGTFLFRSFAFPPSSVQPGQAVLSDAANEQGPKLIQALGNVLAHIGVVLDKSKLGVNKDPEHRPMLDFLATQKRLEPLFSRAMQAPGLSYLQAAESAAIATAILIKQCAPVLDPNLAFGIAAYGFVEGSKTAPDPVVLAGSAV